MKKLLLSFLGMFLTGFMFAQTYPYVDVYDISFVDSTRLANCVDSSAYLGDTITTRGIVVTDGNLSEVGSSSITGGSRPFIAIVDTSNNGTPGPFKGAIIMGADPTNNPVSDIENALAGDIIEITAIVGAFNGLVQLQPLNSTAVSVVGATTVPTFINISAGDIQDAARANKLPTGEQWDGSYVELENMTVTSVSIFSSGSRAEFTIQDTGGSRVLVADRFLPMVVDGVATVNPNSPDTAGSLIAPSVGTIYNHVRGIIFQDQNGCAGGSGFAGGYEINPFDSTDFDKAPSPASVVNVLRNPVTPNDTQKVTVTADIFDNDGTVTSATLYYSADTSAALNLFSSIAMTNTSGTEYTADIPAFALDSVVRYYIEAVDDSSNTTTVPNGEPFVYTVRANGTTIEDIQFAKNLGSASSALDGLEVEITAFVTASYQAGDLGYLYVQDTSASEFGGIYISGNDAESNVLTFNKGDEVWIKGTVGDQFGFTLINVDSARSTGNTATVDPIVLNPSDSVLFSNGSNELERYEGMLVSYENPTGKVWVIDSLGFGEYTVGSGKDATYTARVLAGRQSGTSAQSSLDVSYIADTATYGSGLNVTPVQVDTSFSMDALAGLLYYSFGNYKLTPRNNADFSNLIVSIETIETRTVSSNIYPNPTNDRVNVQIDENYQFGQLNIQLMDITGKTVVETKTAQHLTSLNLFGLERGIYILKVMNGNELINTSKLILK